MFSLKHIRTGAATLLALFTLSIGGAAVANAAQSPSTPPAAVSTATTAKPAVDVAGPNDKADAATDVAGPNDKADAASDVAGPNDKADAAGESVTEVPGGDGPGGHADEVPSQR